ASKETLDILGLLTNDEYDKIEQLTIQISNIIKEELLKKDLELYDIKLEFGKDKETDDILLIDEISGGNMRVYKGEDNIHPLDIRSEEHTSELQSRIDHVCRVLLERKKKIELEHC